MEISPSPTAEAIKIFFSVAPVQKDRDLFEELRKQLLVLRQQGRINIWHDSMISAGSNVRETSQAHIHDANIIVFLLSADFFASEQCYEVEMPYALEQQETRDARILPVLLRPTLWEENGLPLEGRSLLPTNGKAVTVWENLDNALTEVAQGIRRVVNEIAQRLTGTPRPIQPSQPSPQALTYRQNPFFTDRDDILTQLHDYFTVKPDGQTRTLALQGIGGIGKTLIAIEYAYRHRNHSTYQTILYLNASAPETLNADILASMYRLGLPAQENIEERWRYTILRQWLQQHDHWLVILDNVSDFSILTQFLPSASNGHVLLTTHSQVVGPFATSIAINPMTTEDGALLLLRRAGRMQKDDQRDRVSAAVFQQAMAIAREMEGYPLALDQAGAYIEETQRTLDSYLQLYREQQTRFLDRRGQFTEEHPDPVTTTLTLAFDKIAQSNPDALELLRFLAFLDPEGLPDEIIAQGATLLADPLRTLARDPFALDTAITTLRRFSLIQRQADITTLNIPRTIQVVVKGQLTARQQRQFANQAVRLICSIFPNGGFTSWEVCARYIKQAQHCARLIRDFRLTLAEGPLLLEHLGFYYMQRGFYAEAESTLTQAFHLYKRQRRKNLMQIAQTHNSLGLLYQRLARYQEAETHYRQALAIRKQEGEPAREKTLESLHNLALLNAELGNYQLAEHMHLDILAQEEQMPDINHLNIAKVLNDLGLTYYHQGRYQQAEKVYQRALAIYQQTLPDQNHPAMIYPLDGLGALAEVQSNYAQAGEFYQRELKVCQQVYGEAHIETAHCLNKLADIAEAQGNYQQARTLYQQAYTIGVQVVGPEHPDIALFLSNLAFLARDQEDYQQAEELYQRALTIYERVLGTEHPEIANVLNNMGQLAYTIGQKKRAEDLLRKALEIREKASGPTHSDTARSLNDLAELLVDQRRFNEAEPLFKRALSILLQNFATAHPDVVHVREQYATLLETLHRDKEAAQLRELTDRQHE